MKKAFFLSLIYFLFLENIYCQEARLVLPIGHTITPHTVDFSNDGRYVLTSSGDNYSILWDFQSGQLLRKIGSTYGPAVFSHDSRSFFIPKFTSFAEENLARKTPSKVNRFSGNIKGYSTNREMFISIVNGGNTCEIYQTTPFKILKKIEHNFSKLKLAGLSPDADIAYTIDENSVIIWDVRSGKEINVFAKGTSPKLAAFSPDGKFIAVSSDSLKTAIWDVRSGTLYRKFDSMFAPERFLFNPKGNILLVSGFFETKIYNLESSKELMVLPVGENNRIYLFDQAEHLIVGENNDLLLFDLKLKKVTKRLKGHKGTTTFLSNSPDKKFIVSGSSDNTVIIWDPVNFNVVQTLKCDANSIERTSKSPDGKLLATFESDKTVKLWDVYAGKLMSVLKKKVPIDQYIFSNDGKSILTSGSGSDTIEIWDCFSGKIINKIHTPGSYNEQLMTAKTDSLFLIHDISGISTIFNQKGKTISSYVEENPKDSRSKVCLSVDGKKLFHWVEKYSYWETDTPALKLIDLNTKKIVFKINQKTIGKRITSLFPSPDGKTFIVTCETGKPLMFNAITGHLIGSLSAEGDRFKSFGFSSDGKKFLATFKNTTLVWEVATQMLLGRYPSLNYIDVCTFSPDGSLVITSEWGQKIAVWRIEDGKKLHSLSGHSDNVTGIQIAPDNKNLITSARDGTSILWDLSTEKQKFSFLSVKDNDYLVTDENGRYDGTEAARKLLYFTCGQEIVTLDQVKDQLWVTDLGERISFGGKLPKATLNSIDICGLVPIVEPITDTSNFKYVITPGRGGLGVTTLSVNGIEIKKIMPEELRKQKGEFVLTVPKVEIKSFLSASSSNLVTVKAYTADNHVVSRPVEVAPINLPINKQAPNLFAVVIGISEYRSSTLKLRYAANDAAEFTTVIGRSSRKLLNSNGEEHVFIYNLTSNNKVHNLPEKGIIKEVFEEIGKKAQPNDILMIFFAGHGRISADNNFYLLTAEATDALFDSKPSLVGISTDDLIDWIQPTRIKAQKRILIYDACKSAKGMIEIFNGNYLAGRSEDNAIQKKAVDKLNEKSGVYVLSAAAANQNAYEYSSLEHGALTYALLKSIKEQPTILDDGKYLNIAGWFKAAENIVIDFSKESDNVQNPFMAGRGNFNIGIIDNEVLEVINLKGEVPIIKHSNFQNNNEQIADDDLEFGLLLDKALNDYALKSATANYRFIGLSQTPDAYSISGRYYLSNEQIVVNVNIKHRNNIVKRIRVTGTKTNLATLADEIKDHFLTFLKSMKIDGN